MNEIRLIPSQCTYISSINPNNNYGRSGCLLSGTHTDRGIYRSLFQFDLNSLSENVVIKSVNLILYADCYDGPTYDGLFTAYLVNSDWYEDVATWNVQPSINTVISGSTVKVSRSGWYTWDITEIAQSWMQNINENYGLLIKSAEDGSIDSKCFLANVNRFNMNRPYLHLTYDCLESMKLSSRKVYCRKETYQVEDCVQFSEWHNVSKYSMYTFFVQNVGCAPVDIDVQISPNQTAVYNESATYRVLENDTTAITPRQYAFFNRLAFSTDVPNKSTRLKIWFQAQV